MARPVHLTPKSKAVRDYYSTLQEFAGQDVTHETAIRMAFQNLLADSARLRGWTLIPELSTESRGRMVVPDGTVRDRNYLPRGHWEAKDTNDDLEAEIRKKIGKGYPTNNIIFEDTRQGVLYQDKREVLRVDLTEAGQLCDLVNQFHQHTEPEIETFEKAVEEFKDRVPGLALGLREKLEEAHKKNRPFQGAFEQFFDVCRQALNPNLSREAVDEMLIQHLLTERLFRTVFRDADFTRRNVIAAEIEKVIDALVSESFSRWEYLKSLDRFYVAIEDAARNLPDFSDKQHFLNTVYEQFFQGYSVKVADTHGIVYTPQPIVDFMCASVEEVLKTEFGLSLSSPEVVILDPCTGTGNFVVNLMRRIPKRDLSRVYREQLFANEVMLLPYYIASLNIEHAYYELTGKYEPFEGLCFVDSLDLAESRQSGFSFMTEKNTERVDREKAATVTVIVGNPPYNVGQIDENDNNKNRQYKLVDQRVHDTYAKDSLASSVFKLSDAYVKFFRWATDRLGAEQGVLSFVSNNGFIDGIGFDGFRRGLSQEFDEVYHLNLKGNARTSGERRKREGGNIFNDQIRAGVGITVLVKRQEPGDRQVLYHEVADCWNYEQKTGYLLKAEAINGVQWEFIEKPDKRAWVPSRHSLEFESFVDLGQRKGDSTTNGIFQRHSIGLNTNRDEWVYAFGKDRLKDNVKAFINTYNSEVDRWKREGQPEGIDDFVLNDPRRTKWSSRLKETLQRGLYAGFDEKKIRRAMYRPFTKKFVFFDDILNHRQGLWKRIEPVSDTERVNIAMVVSDKGSRTSQASVLCTSTIADLHLCAAADGHQCFPFYVYNKDGTNRQENITDWALAALRSEYGDTSIAKWDIFYYVYALLHHPGYREKFAGNLKRELPRIPFAPDFQAFAEAGRELAALHLDYERLAPYELEFVEDPERPLSYRVEKMRLSKDKRELKVNESLTLRGIPEKCFEYRLGNRSALDWVIDQYRVKEHKRSGIVSDPNREDDEEYIVRLVGQVIRVSLETVRIVESLPREYSKG